MSSWDIDDEETSAVGWSSFDEMVWKEFGESDDHIVPGESQDVWASRTGTGTGTTTATGGMVDRRKRLHIDQVLGVQKTGEAESEWESKQEELREQEQEAVVVSTEKLVGFSEAQQGGEFLGFSGAMTAFESTLSESKQVEQGEGGCGVLTDMRVYMSNNDIFNREDPAIVSTSCHFQLNEVGPAEGDVDFLEDEEEDCFHNTMTKYGCDSMSTKEGDVKIEEAEGQTMGRTAGSMEEQSRGMSLAAETQQWLVTTSTQELPGGPPPGGASGMVMTEGLSKECGVHYGMEDVKEEGIVFIPTGSADNQMESHFQGKSGEKRKEGCSNLGIEEVSGSGKGRDSKKTTSSRLIKASREDSGVSEMQSESVGGEECQTPSTNGSAGKKKGKKPQRQSNNRRTASPSPSMARTLSSSRLHSLSAASTASPLSSPSVTLSSQSHSHSQAGRPHERHSPALPPLHPLISPSPSPSPHMAVPVSCAPPALPLPSLNLMRPHSLPLPPPPMTSMSMATSLHHMHSLGSHASSSGMAAMTAPTLFSPQMQQQQQQQFMPSRFMMQQQQQQQQQQLLQQQQQQQPFLHSSQGGLLEPTARAGTPYMFPAGPSTAGSALSLGAVRPHPHQQPLLQPSSYSLMGPPPSTSPHPHSMHPPQAQPQPQAQAQAPHFFLPPVPSPSPSPSVTPMTPLEKIEKLRWRQQMRQAAAGNHNRTGNGVMTWQQQQQQGQAGQGEVEVEADVEGEVDEQKQKPQGQVKVEEGGGGVSEDGVSMEEVVLHELECTMVKLDIGTRLCIRDALFRLARSSMHRKAAAASASTTASTQTGALKTAPSDEEGSRSHSQGGEAREGFGEGGDVEVKREGEDPASSLGAAQGMLASAASSTRLCASFLETETNPIDRNIANLLFHRPIHSHTAAAQQQQQRQQQQQQLGAQSGPMLSPPPPLPPPVPYPSSHPPLPLSHGQTHGRLATMPSPLLPPPLPPLPLSHPHPMPPMPIFPPSSATDSRLYRRAPPPPSPPLPLLPSPSLSPRPSLLHQHRHHHTLHMQQKFPGGSMAFTNQRAPHQHGMATPSVSGGTYWPRAGPGAPGLLSGGDVLGAGVPAGDWSTVVPRQPNGGALMFHGPAPPMPLDGGRIRQNGGMMSVPSLVPHSPSIAASASASAGVPLSPASQLSAQFYPLSVAGSPQVCVGDVGGVGRGERVAMVSISGDNQKANEGVGGLYGEAAVVAANLVDGGEGEGSEEVEVGIEVRKALEKNAAAAGRSKTKNLQLGKKLKVKSALRKGRAPSLKGTQKSTASGKGKKITS